MGFVVLVGGGGVLLAEVSKNLDGHMFYYCVYIRGHFVNYLLIYMSSSIASV